MLGPFVQTKIQSLSPTAEHNKLQFYLKTVTDTLLGVQHNVHLAFKAAKEANIIKTQ